MLPDILSVTLRAVSFIAVLQAAGVALFLAQSGVRLLASAQGIRRLGRWSAAVGLTALLLHYLLEAARLAGSFSGLVDLSLQSMVLSSTTPLVLGVRVLGLLAIATSLREEKQGAHGTGVFGAGLLAVSFALTGHTATHPVRWLLAPLLVLHVLVVAFWFGALWPLLLVARQETVARTASVVGAFSRAAGWVVPGLFLAGLALVLQLVPTWAALVTPYGLLLLGKAALFALLMGLAVLNKWRLGPALANGDSGALVAFERSVVAEFVLICLVLSMTAVMTTFHSPYG